ncbi:MAG: hypothetical protein KIT80_02565 [Chitinophagaceae bacterium]|nr:hypothetical protein [Chitinophagaceae bacterium]MCW5925769.1 hypothetical protein [Chitinophagaceae bacterium]
MKQAFFFIIASLTATAAFACEKCGNYNNDNFQISSVSVKHSREIAATIWEISVKGQAGKTTPTPAGQLNGAPVLGYVFPTSLQPTDVGFSQTEGILALALTSHPDFDDTPLWDENSDGKYDNDGIIWHPHWVVLTEDKRVEGGLAVKQFAAGDNTVTLPPTNPGMPMYMDSPGFQVITRGNTIKVVVPDYRINNKTDFSYDGVTAYMQVNTGGDGGHGTGDKPMLGVYKVYAVASGNLSLPYKVKQ